VVAGHAGAVAGVLHQRGATSESKLRRHLPEFQTARDTYCFQQVPEPLLHAFVSIDVARSVGKIRNLQTGVKVHISEYVLI